jgi:hypothetical protein
LKSTFEKSGAKSTFEKSGAKSTFTKVEQNGAIYLFDIPVATLSVAMLSVATLSVAMLLAPPFLKVEKVDKVLCFFRNGSILGSLGPELTRSDIG